MKAEGAVGPGSEHDVGDVDDDLEADEASEANEADESLRAMRSVWLSMRDEEPGEGGLSALLAAAHAKAAELRPPSVWQRIGAMLRRPPALAFATVLVLVGGAVVVSQQAKDEPPPMATLEGAGAARESTATTAAPTAVSAIAAPPAGAGPTGAAGDGEAETSTRSGGGAPPAAPPAPPAPPAHGALADTQVAKQPSPKSAKKPSREKAKIDAFEDGIAQRRVSQDDAPAPATSATSAEMPSPPPPPAPSEAAGMPSPTPAPVTTANRSEGKVPDGALAALERKVRKAADAGDCATVQQLMAELGRRDAQARERVAQRPSIQSCLTRAAAPAAAK